MASVDFTKVTHGFVFESEQTRPSYTDNFVMEDEDLLRKDTGNLRSKRFRAV